MILRWIAIVLLAILIGAWEVIQPPGFFWGFTIHPALPMLIVGVMFFRERYMLVFGGVVGLMLDLYNGGLPDLASFRYLLLVFLLFRFTEHIVTRRSIISLSLVFVLTSLVDHTLAFLISRVFQWSSVFHAIWMNQGISPIQVGIDMLFAIVLYTIGQKFGLTHQAAEGGTFDRYARTQDLF